MTKDYPHFLGIGAARTGSTWLYHLLWQHPRLWLPPVKELHYFDAVDDSLSTRSYRYRSHLPGRLKHYGAALILPIARGRQIAAGIKLDPYWDLTYFLGRSSSQWYRSLFAKAALAGHTTGEITPSYAILSRDTIEQIWRLNSDLKIIYFMRDPIDRSWSAASRWLPRKHNRPLSGIQDEEFLDFFASPHCSLQSDYLRTLDNWCAHFGPDNIFVRCLEDIEEDPRGLAQEVMRFLGVDDDLAHFQGDLGRKRNASSPRDGIPPRLERILAEMYEPRLRVMRNVIGARAVQWHERAVGVLTSAA